MSPRQRAARTDLLLVRPWIAETSAPDGAVALRGRVQRLISGESYPFNDWSRLTALLARLTAIQPDTAAGAPRNWPDQGAAPTNSDGEK